jgi:ribosomal protein L36
MSEYVTPVSINESCQLIRHKEIIAVYFKNHTKHQHKTCGLTEDFLDVKTVYNVI